MCGIAGFYTTTPLDPDRARMLTSALLYYSEDRGKQSAGVYVDGQILKRATDPGKFMALPEYAALFAKPVRLVLTHTRQPTSGGRDDEHAQPFQVGAIATAHNGVISNEPYLRKKFEIENPSGVDSELVTAFVAKHGVSKLPDFFEAMQGCAAVAIVDDGRLYLARSSNPIESLYINTGNARVFAFASTQSILLNALRYLWLLPPTTRTDTLKQDQVFRVKMDDLKPASRKAAGVDLNWLDDDDRRYKFKGSNHRNRYQLASLEERKAMTALAEKEAFEMGGTIEAPTEWGYWLVLPRWGREWVSWEYGRFSKRALPEKAKPNGNGSNGHDKKSSMIWNGHKVEYHKGNWGYWESVNGSPHTKVWRSLPDPVAD
jgi:asparagine synthetase B (glutamine-hydrolysing)